MLTAEQQALQLECEQDGIFFNRYFMRQTTGTKMLVGAHHHVVQQALDSAIDGDVTRLIINLPPGYSKTTMASINMIARGMAINNKARFMHLSYSANLALLNSSTARGVIKSAEYRAMWPLDIRADADSKGMWWTHEGGGVYATSTMGQVTGFRAGHMDETEFTGAILIDDPIKPADALSETIREGVNNNYGETIASRLAVESVPIILIMQRVHYNDLSGYLLRGGSGEKWHHLNLPVQIDSTKPYPPENTHGVPIPHNLPDGWLWPAKHRDEHLDALRAHRRKWQAQYLQDPKRFDAEGALWTERMISDARQRAAPDNRKRVVIGVDPAVSQNENSDLTGIVAASSYADGGLSVDGDYSLKASPAGWATAAINAYDNHSADAIVVEVNQGGDLCESNLRANGFTGRIIKVHAAKGKFARAEPIAARYEQGFVHHDPEADLIELETELLEYVPISSRKSPDRLDAAVWALTELSGGAKTAAVW